MCKLSTTRPWGKSNRCTKITAIPRMSSLKLWTKFSLGSQSMKLWKEQRSNSCLNLKETKILQELDSFKNTRNKTEDSGSSLKLKRWITKKNLATWKEQEPLMSKKFLTWDSTLSNSQVRSENTLKLTKNVMTWKWKLAWQLRKLKDLTEFLRKEMHSSETIRINYSKLRQNQEPWRVNSTEWEPGSKQNRAQDLRLRIKSLSMKVNWERSVTSPKKLLSMRIRLPSSMKKEKDSRLHWRLRPLRPMREIEWLGIWNLRLNQARENSTTWREEWEN